MINVQREVEREYKTQTLKDRVWAFKNQPIKNNAFLQHIFLTFSKPPIFTFFSTCNHLFNPPPNQSENL